MDIEKVLMAIVGIGMVTTLVLPGRQTPQVTASAFTGASKFLGTAMGTARPA